MLIANPWYESGSFWQFAITTVVAVTVGALGAFATMRASNPKRRLEYRSTANTSLLTSHEGAGRLEVTYDATPVAEPRVIELELWNAGRRDITAIQFHDNGAITYDLGVSVVDVLKVASSPAGTAAPAVLVDDRGKGIAVPPFLLKRNQTVSISILVDGPERPVTCLEAPLIDVQVQQAPEFPTEGWLWQPSPFAHPLALPVTVFVGIMCAYLGSRL